jgi:hypothetical protein
MPCQGKNPAAFKPFGLNPTSASLSVLASMLRMNLITYRDLMDWLDDPMNTPPMLPLPEQLEFDLG